MFDLQIKTDLSKVPPPTASGRVVVFVGADKKLKVKDETGAIVDAAEKGDDGVDSNPVAVGQLSLNIARAGIVAGLIVQSVDIGQDLILKNFCIKGSLKFVSTANGTASVLVNIGGLLVNFVGVALTASTQYFNYEIDIMVITGDLAAGRIRQNIAALGSSSTVVGASNQAVSGAVASQVVNVLIKTPVATKVTNLLSNIQVS